MHLPTLTKERGAVAMEYAFMVAIMIFGLFAGASFLSEQTEVKLNSAAAAFDS